MKLHKCKKCCCVVEELWIGLLEENNLIKYVSDIKLVPIEMGTGDLA